MQVQKNISILLILLALSFASFGQTNHFYTTIGVKAPPFKMPVFVKPNLTLLFEAPDLQLSIASNDIKTPFYTIPGNMPPAFNSPVADRILNVAAFLSDFSQRNMPFFCRMEYQIEKGMDFPVKMRIGDVEWVDRIEGKRDWDLGN